MHTAPEKGTIWRVVPGCATRCPKKDQPYVFKISSPHNLSWKYEHFKILSCSSSFCDTWPLIPYFILILVYIPWRISRLPFTFQRVCLCLTVTWSERGQAVSFQALTAFVGTATVGSYHLFAVKVKYQLYIQIQSKIQFAANWRQSGKTLRMTFHLCLVLFFIYVPVFNHV